MRVENLTRQASNSCSLDVCQTSKASKRRHWTTGEVTEIIWALREGKTSDISKALGVNPKALRSLLRRNGISLRGLRDGVRQNKQYPCSGLDVRRPSEGPSAIYGAAALESLAESACRWPFGDPAEPSFSFCGKRAVSRGSYCAFHRATAYNRNE